MHITSIEKLRHILVVYLRLSLLVSKANESGKRFLEEQQRGNHVHDRRDLCVLDEASCKCVHTALAHDLGSVADNIRSSVQVKGC